MAFNYDSFVSDPLLHMGLGLLGSKGSFNNALSTGLLGGMQSYNVMQQVMEKKKAQEQARLQEEARQKYMQNMMQQANPQQQQILQGHMAGVPSEALNLMFPQQKPTDDIKEYQQAQQQGYKGSFMEYMRDVKGASAPVVNTTVNTGSSSVAQQIGPMLKESRLKAQGAIKMFNSADRMERALNSGKVIAGPTATIRMAGAQIANMLGISGPDSVIKTREVIRSLAESAVEARKELAGQGQVTENEAKAVEKAMAGNIDDLTAEEISLIANLNKKAAKFTAEQYASELSAMPKEMEGLRPFFELQGMAPILQYSPPGQGSVSGFKVIGRE